MPITNMNFTSRTQDDYQDWMDLEKDNKNVTEFWMYYPKMTESDKDLSNHEDLEETSWRNPCLTDKELEKYDLVERRKWANEMGALFLNGVFHAEDEIQRRSQREFLVY